MSSKAILLEYLRAGKEFSKLMKGIGLVDSLTSRDKSALLSYVQDLRLDAFEEASVALKFFNAIKKNETELLNAIKAVLDDLDGDVLDEDNKARLRAECAAVSDFLMRLDHVSARYLTDKFKDINQQTAKAIDAIKSMKSASAILSDKVASMSIMTRLMLGVALIGASLGLYWCLGSVWMASLCMAGLLVVGLSVYALVSSDNTRFKSPVLTAEDTKAAKEKAHTDEHHRKVETIRAFIQSKSTGNIRDALVDKPLLAEISAADVTYDTVSSTAKTFRP